MREIVAVIGSRWGHDPAALTAFMHELPRDTIVISGGADGADLHAENTWRSLGGEVWSLRPVEDEETKHWGVEGWIFRPGSLPESKRIDWTFIWKDRRSACLFRDLMISDECHRLMSFFRPGGSPGAMFTLVVAQEKGKPVSSQELVLK